MASIFLSYAREDRACAETLARVLEGVGHSMWWDRHIGGGSEFAGEIETALNAADVVLVAWSNNSVKSRWVRDEAASGADSGKLLPLSIDGSQPPMGFRQFHTLDLTGWKGAKKDGRTPELLRAVERKLKGDAEARPVPLTSRSAGLKRRLAGRPLWGIAAALVLLVAAGAAYYFWAGRDQLRGPPPKPTIALLPFTTASSDTELRNIAAQARNSLSHTLSKSGIPVRLLNSVPQDRRSTGDFLISGEVTKSGDNVIATVHVDEAIHGITIVTSRLEAAGDDVGNLPERIGVHMADFFGDNLILDRRHPIDPGLMAELLSGQVGDFVGNYQIAKRVAAKAPDEPNALTALAFFTGFALPELPRDERQQAVIEARRAVERALKLRPEYGGPYPSWCLLHSESRLAECEDHIRAGSRIDPDAPWPREFLAELMQKVGRFSEAAELANLAYTRAPYSLFMIRGNLRMLEFKGDAEVLGELVPKAVRWYPGFKASFFRNRLYGLLYRGDFEAMQLLEKEASDVLPPDYTASGAIAAAIKSKSQPVLRRICAPATPEEYLLAIRCMIAFGKIGDLDSAYALADKFYPRRIGRRPEETERIWLEQPQGGGPTDHFTSPAAAPMRRDPRYLQLAERTGLLAYWRSGRPPDFCRRDPEPICGRLLKRT